MAGLAGTRASRWMVGVAALAVGFGASAVLASDTAPPPINGCYSKRDGSLRVLTTGTCNSKTETPISWAVQGPPGADGADGADGAPGPAGPAVIIDRQCPDGTVVTGFDEYGRMMCQEPIGSILGPPTLVGDPVGASDTDGDGVIDPEDSCPTSPGPWCPTSVYDIRSGDVPAGAAVSFDVVITSQNAFIAGNESVFEYVMATGQVVSGMPDFLGVPNSSIGFLHNPGAQVGDHVRVQGVVVSDTIVDAGVAENLPAEGLTPTPLHVDANELVSSDFVYGLVSVANVTVADQSDGTWVIDGGVEVVGFPQTGVHLPAVENGATVTEIVGILSGGPQLYPRSPEDITLS